MQIQVSTANNVDGDAQLATQIESAVTSALQRFQDHITRVEVHITDENGGKGGADDKRCVMEARLERHQPVVVTHQAETIKQAYSGATTKLKTALTTTLGRLATH